MRLTPRSVLRPLILATLCAVLAVGCSTTKPDHDKFVQVLEQSGLPKAEATCAADAIFKNLSDAQIAKIMKAGSSAVPIDDPARTDDPHDLVINTLAVCRDKAPPGAVTTTTALTVTTSTAPQTSTAPPASTTIAGGPTSTTGG